MTGPRGADDTGGGLSKVSTVPNTAATLVRGERGESKEGRGGEGIGFPPPSQLEVDDPDGGEGGGSRGDERRAARSSTHTERMRCRASLHTFSLPATALLPCPPTVTAAASTSSRCSHCLLRSHVHSCRLLMTPPPHEPISSLPLDIDRSFQPPSSTSPSPTAGGLQAARGCAASGDALRRHHCASAASPALCAPLPAQ